MSDYGFTSVLPLSFFLSVGVMIGGYVLALRVRPLSAPILWAYNVVFIVVIRGTPQIVYPAVRYSWIYKHAGVVDYIMRHGTVDRYISFLGIYHNWPGFFALGALYTEAAGLTSALAFAGWSPIFMNILYTGALLLLMRSETRDERLPWLGVWLFGLANWIGQDTFAPQALAYFLFLCMIAVCRRWFRGGVPLWEWSMVPARVRAGRFSSFFDRRIPREYPPALSAPYRVALIGMLLGFFVVIASSHQLTPFLTLGLITLLVLCGHCSLRWLPVVMAAVIAIWLLGPAFPWVSANTHTLFGSLLTLDANVQGSLKNTAVVPFAQRVVAYAARGSALVILLLASAGFMRRRHDGRWKPAMAIGVIAPLPWIALTSYGSEGIDRVYYFALPFLVFYAASAFYPQIGSGRSVRSGIALTTITLGIAATLLLAYYGLDRMNLMPRDELRAVTYVTATSPAGSLLVTAASNDPIQFHDYEHFSYLALTDMFYNSKPGTYPLSRVISVMQGPYPSAYLMFTTSSAISIHLYADSSPGLIPRIEAEASTSPAFRLVYRSSHAVVFQYQPGVTSPPASHSPGT